jgi:uncharacterized Fe-S cluster protein YjdI
LHESEFRNSFLWSIDAEGFEDVVITSSDCVGNSESKDLEEGWRKNVIDGRICNGLKVKFVTSDIGYGLFASMDIPEGTFIGEYVGIIYSAQHGSDALPQYVLSYPSCEGNINLNALEQGNITRFINHCPSSSAACNVIFKTLVTDGFCSVVCVTTKLVVRGQQLLVDYGKSFWIGKDGCNPVEV